MNRSNHTANSRDNATPPSALIVFVHGFNKLPLIVPNGGSVEADDDIMRWLEQKLSPQQNNKKAA